MQTLLQHSLVAHPNRPNQIPSPSILKHQIHVFVPQREGSFFFYLKDSSISLIPEGRFLNLINPGSSAMASVKISTSKGQAWFCTTGLPSDAIIEVAEMSFHLHKFPLMSKSRKLHQLITKLEQGPGSPSTSQEELKEVAPPHIILPDFPGGTETFETAAKFCYGVKIDLTPWNAVPLRCAAEYLDMADDYAEENLISRTERFLSHSILRGLGESIQALKSCEDVLQLAEELGIVQRCIESIAARADSANSCSLFGWPVSEVAAAAAGSGGDHRPVLWNGIDTGARLRRSRARTSFSTLGGASAAAPPGPWQEDLTVLTLPIYKRVIAAMRAADPRSDLLEGSLVSYAKRSFPGLSRSSRKPSSAPIASEAEQRDLLETLILNLPPLEADGRRRGGIPILTAKFLAGLLRTVNIIRASEASRKALEQRLASQLEEATVDDLLLPSYSYTVETLYDVDYAERVLRYYLEIPFQDNGEGLVRVGKLIDGYLGEIASDANLTVEKFCDLALAIPEGARVYDDGLYRAVDVYLKAHPLLVEDEREKICGVMDCQKLTLEACTHAAQNERMPLRAVVQVLFFEQLQLRQAIAGTVEAAAVPAPADAGGTWRAAVRENQVLRIDMDSMRNRVQELERDCGSMRRKVERLDGRAAVAPAPPPGGGWRKFGCKFKTQVCDSHERAVVEARRNRPNERSP